MRTGDSLRQENLQQFGRLVTPKKFVARVPAVYLTSAEGTILAFWSFIEINKLRAFKPRMWFESLHPPQLKQWVRMVVDFSRQAL